MQRRNMLIAQSGGPSSAINASLAGAVSRAMASDKIDTVYGGLNGLEGILERRIISLSDQMRTASDFTRLIHTPAMALGSCRYKLDKNNTEVYEKILAILRDYDIGYFFYIGGNDSMDTVASLSAFFKDNGEEIKCIGIPKTIDNDLVHTDHTPGFGSAARFIAASFAEIMIDASIYSPPSVTVVEVMGRNAGWLTASSVLARTDGMHAPHLIYLPESPFNMDAFLEKIDDNLKTEKQVVVAVSEGVRYEDGSYVAQSESRKVDMFGHKPLGGAAEVLEGRVRDNFNVKTRSVEPSVLQRVGVHLASGVDLNEGCDVGVTAVQKAIDGVTDVMITINRTSNKPYLVRYDTAPLSDVANHERKVPQEWICDEGTNVTQEMVDYLRPLFRGKTDVEYVDGIPHFFQLDKTKIIKK